MAELKIVHTADAETEAVTLAPGIVPQSKETKSPGGALRAAAERSSASRKRFAKRLAQFLVSFNQLKEVF